MSGSSSGSNPSTRVTRSSSTTLRSGRTLTTQLARLGVGLGERLNSSIASLSNSLNTEGQVFGSTSSVDQDQSQHGSSENRERKAGINSRNGGNSGHSDQQTTRSQQMTGSEAKLPSGLPQQLEGQMATHNTMQDVSNLESRPSQQGKVSESRTSTEQNVQSNVTPMERVQQNNFSNVQTNDNNSDVQIQNTQQQQLQTIKQEENSQQLNSPNARAEDVPRVNNLNNFNLSQQSIGQNCSQISQNLENIQVPTTAVDSSRDIVNLLHSRNTSLDASVQRILQENQHQQEATSQTQVMRLLTQMNAQMESMAQYNERMNDRMLRLEQKLAKHSSPTNSDSGIISPDLEHLYGNVTQRRQPPAERERRTVSHKESDSPFSRMTSSEPSAGVLRKEIGQTSQHNFIAHNTRQNSNTHQANSNFNTQAFEHIPQHTQTSQSHVRHSHRHTQHHNGTSNQQIGHTSLTQQQPMHIHTVHTPQLSYPSQVYPTQNTNMQQPLPSLDFHGRTADKFMRNTTKEYFVKSEHNLNSFRTTTSPGRRKVGRQCDVKRSSVSGRTYEGK